MYKMFVCPVCNYEFHRASKLKSHVMLMHVGSGWPSAAPCGQENCLRTFGSVEKWYNHVRKQHRFLEENLTSNPKRPRVGVSRSPKNKTQDATSICQDDCSDTGKKQCFYKQLMCLNDFTIFSEIDDNRILTYQDYFNDFKDEIKNVSAKFVATLRANSSVTASTCDLAIKLCNDVVDIVVHGVRETTVKFIQDKQSTLDAAELLDMFEQISRPLEFLSDNRKQQQYFRSLGTYVNPVEYSFGSRHHFEPITNPVTNHVTQREAHNTWMYVPIKETLRVILSQPGFIDHIKKEGRKDEFIQEFVDGRIFSTNALFV